ncbi:hypothetical protein A6R71_16770 [Xanthomonas translucens pv. arrhenatheri]|uniref:Uncharacterized protein n=1 Tax=Xanthomonas graminis pv. arrhenatheri LMG 727 TaxID=1195923 RepID=A0A0K2ZD18_9XANT|nr:hypothetical protein [Xanthomonas translucens]OAX67025.1 hypothetical protein A6R71_16770 [Xanthomonas translucens pv. arrhenatheri]UKE78210.1 hypothetical protein KM317_02885 [Xanthomonas translucens pv. arrhenatheri]CTP83228.1 hypothetical protein XTALMG727_0560 [Xanthomonas translucens pv. arrhenatheri LMG 727]
MQNEISNKRLMGYVHARALSHEEISQVSGGDDDGDDGDKKKPKRTKITVGGGANGSSRTFDDN